MNEREVEDFMDEYLARQLEKEKIPGATVSVVEDGKVLFAKGYGQADVRNDEPVVADETLFRIASTSKLFTATAVMQLVQEGKLDLDRDVNYYLDDVEIPNTYPGRPVTLRHLLTHTAGFEEEFTGSLARDADEVVPLGEYLSENVPARVRPPGEVTSYSNYGMALAGHVVEETSGMPYDRYLEENVFGPSGMRSTTAAQPPAPALRNQLATGYDVGKEGPVAGPFEYIDEAPAGAVSTTSTDMARFMIAHLNEGRYGEERILGVAAAHQMHKQQFANARGLEDGMGLGFYEQTINGKRTIQHAGNLIRFHALLTLVPDRDVGVFVAYNSYGDGGDFAEYELTDAFFDRFYPKEGATPIEPSTADAARNAERFAGSYRSTRSNATGFEKVSTLMTGARIVANPDGSLTTHGMYLSRDPEKTEQRWVKVAPATFRSEDGDERIAFRKSGSEAPTYLASDADPTSAYARLPFYETPRLHVGLLAGSLAVLILSTLAWVTWAMISWWRGRQHRKLHGKHHGKWEIESATRRARLLASAVSVLAVVFLMGLAAVLSNAVSILGYSVSPILVGVLTVPILISALSAGVLVYAALAWARGNWSLQGRLHYTLVALSTLTFVALLAYYNLIGYQF